MTAGIDLNDVDPDLVLDIVFPGFFRIISARMHLCSLTDGYFCEKAEKSHSLDEAVHYYREAIYLIQSDFERSDFEFGYYLNNKMTDVVQYLKESYNYCLDRVSVSINRRLNASAEENESKELLVESIKKMRSKIESRFTEEPR